MRFLLGLLFFAGALIAQNPACLTSTGTAPHCVVLTWSPPTTGDPPTSYNVYQATATGNCSTLPVSPLPAGCTLLGGVTAPTATFQDNSTPASPLTPAKAYFFVVTAVNGGGESKPSSEASAVIPFLVSGPPVSLTGTPH